MQLGSELKNLFQLCKPIYSISKLRMDFTKYIPNTLPTFGMKLYKCKATIAAGISMYSSLYQLASTAWQLLENTFPKCPIFIRTLLRECDHDITDL